MHEEFLRGSIAEIARDLRERKPVKGEITLIVEGSRPERPAVAAPSTVVNRMRELTVREALDEKAALKQAAKEFGISRSEAYREWQRGNRASGNRR
jgi:16S rRNA (cytidine1402-2'-O)-methyltransferase